MMRPDFPAKTPDEFLSYRRQNPGKFAMGDGFSSSRLCIHFTKNLPGLGPLGPWIVTRDEIPDPSVLVLVLEMRVDGKVRQSADCQDLIFSFPAMVAYWSRMELARGDVVEAEVKQIGVLTTFIT